MPAIPNTTARPPSSVRRVRPSIRRTDSVENNNAQLPNTTRPIVGQPAINAPWGELALFDDSATIETHTRMAFGLVRWSIAPRE